MGQPLYKWQQAVIAVIVVLTTTSLLIADRGNGGDGHFRSDLFTSFIFANGVNILVWWLIFKGLNWVYRYFKKL